jgi:rubrerythrin
MPTNPFRNVAEIVTFAIGREIEAAEAYARWAGLARTPGLRELLLDLRDQEVAHRRLLEGLTDEAIRSLEPAFVPDMAIVDALADEPLSGDMTVQEVLIFAARKEKQAAELYGSLARTAAGTSHEQLFLFLAGQEREHKLRLEAEYERNVLQEN